MANALLFFHAKKTQTQNVAFFHEEIINISSSKSSIVDHSEVFITDFNNATKNLEMKCKILRTYRKQKTVINIKESKCSKCDLLMKML